MSSIEWQKSVINSFDYIYTKRPHTAYMIIVANEIKKNDTKQDFHQNTNFTDKIFEKFFMRNH